MECPSQSCPLLFHWEVGRRGQEAVSDLQEQAGRFLVSSAVYPWLPEEGVDSSGAWPLFFVLS